MRNRWSVALVLLAGCLPALPDDPPTAQVASTPFTPPRRNGATMVNYAPASEATCFRVVMMKDKILEQNPQYGIKPAITAIGSPDPEIFHVGMNQIYITEGLVRQCQTDGQLAAVIANEIGRMISEREAAVAEDIRSPERTLPTHLPIGSTGNSRDADPLNHVQLALHEKRFPKQHPKLTVPNPQLIARDILERTGYQRTELDAALPILANADRCHILEGQLKGTVKQADWTSP